MTRAIDLINADRAYVEAPAGCGKTHLIAEAVRIDSNHRNLILTHTHAGVDALRRKLKALGARPSSCVVETIAGWSLRLVLSFPETTGINEQRPVSDQWRQVYKAAKHILSIKSIQEVVVASYDGIFVDEYQDCSVLQHRIILTLAEIVRTRVLGDPLQGIFDFDEIVDWRNDVETNFERLPSLQTPHRWIRLNRDLGEWLLTIRDHLKHASYFDIRSANAYGVRIIYPDADPRKRAEIERRVCMGSNFPIPERLVIIKKHEQQCVDFERKSGGKFRSPETIECKDLFEFCKKIDAAKDGIELATIVWNFCEKSFSNLEQPLKNMITRVVINGRNRNKSRYKYEEQLLAFLKLKTTMSIKTVLEAVISIDGIPVTKKARYELICEMNKALQEYIFGKYDSLEKAAIVIRERTRKAGRYLGRYIVSRTLLIKGLEFEHVVIPKVEEFDRKNLYVALTRASKSLTIISNTPVLDLS